MPGFDEVSRARAAEALGAAVAEAGEVALGHFRQGTRRWRKSDGTPVSAADMAVDELLQERLRSAFPDFGWISEESLDAPAATGKPVWIVDPIDGTQCFLDGVDGWCIAAALLENGRPTLAAVLQPTTGDYFAAVAGGGATLNDRPMLASRRSELQGAKMLVRPRVLARPEWAQAFPPVHLDMIGSIALRLCFVGAGRCDASLALGDKADWDLAAGDLIVHEAGGVVGDLDGARFGYGPGRPRRSGFIASGVPLMPAILKRTMRQGTTVPGGLHG